MNSKSQHKGAKAQRHNAYADQPLVSLSLRVFVLCLLFLAFFLRLHQLDAQSLWNDEGNAYVQATRSFGDIATNAARDIHPPGYYWLLAGWRLLLGESEFVLRSLSVFASVLTVAFTYALGRRLFNPAAGIIAAGLVALNTFSIYYAQEARMYALLGLWGAAGMWILSNELRVMRDEVGTGHVVSLRRILPLALINAAGLYTQYAYPFIMLAQGIIVLLYVLITFLYGQSRNTKTRTQNFFQNPQSSVLITFFIANLIAIVLFLPWMPTALKQVTSWPSTGAPIPAGEALTTILGWFTYGITYPGITGAAGYLPLALVLALLGLLITIRVKSDSSVGSTRGIGVIFPLVWVLVPVGLFLILGLFRPANLKFLLPAQIGLVLLIGGGIGGWWTLGQREGLRLTRLFALLQVLWLLVYLINGLPPLYSDPAYQRPDYRGIVARILSDPRPGDAVILDAPNQEEVFRYYYRGAAPVYPLPAGLGGDDAAALAAVAVVIENHDRIFVLFWGEAERDPNRVIERALDERTFQAGIDEWYGDVRFAVYAAPVEMPAPTESGAQFGDSIMLESYALSGETARPGDVLQIELNWQTDAALDRPYKIFVQLLNSHGVLVAQRDSEPVGGSMPTTSWQPGELITDRHGLFLPADLPPGDYRLIVGLYDRDDPAERLPVGEDDYVELASIRLEK